ncbi:MAG: DNA primase [Simkaniaceae bacterium]|nr:DNA primase [Simkaniaceae bacterium]
MIGSMEFYAQHSLDTLKGHIDIVAVISPHVRLKRSGSVHKGLCPFHEEKTPSFTVDGRRGSYHCFGCGAHGDGIAFLMNRLRFTFPEAVKALAEQFGVTLESEKAKSATEGKKVRRAGRVGKEKVRKALEAAAELYRFYLLRTDEGHVALRYLHERAIDSDCIRTFEIGLAPANGELFRKFMGEERDEVLEEAGLLKKCADGRMRPLFQGRIMFPIHDPFRRLIGFSGRKVREEGFGPKYLNSPETILFKKARSLYGLGLSRRRIIREKRVLIVEGQIDALRLIREGFDFAVGGQGTAFGKEHVALLDEMGVTLAYLALDGDPAGREAAVKIGDLLQRAKTEVRVVRLPADSDPDAFLRTEGREAFARLLDRAEEYLPFLFSFFSEGTDMGVPSNKQRVVEKVASRIREWKHPVMVDKSLRILAKLARVPEKMLGAHDEPLHRPQPFVRRWGSLSDAVSEDPERTFEIDLLRWLLLVGGSDERLTRLIMANIGPEHFYVPLCRHIFTVCGERLRNEEEIDPVSLMNVSDSLEERLLCAEILKKKVNRDRAEEGVTETIKRLLERETFRRREEISEEIRCGRYSEEELSELAKRFDDLKESNLQILFPD